MTFGRIFYIITLTKNGLFRGYSFPIMDRKLDDEGCHWFTRRTRQKTQYR